MVCTSMLLWLLSAVILVNVPLATLTMLVPASTSTVVPTIHAAVTARASMWLLRALGSLAAATPVMSPPIWCV